MYCQEKNILLVIVTYKYKVCIKNKEHIIMFIRVEACQKMQYNTVGFFVCVCVCVCVFTG